MTWPFPQAWRQIWIYLPCDQPLKVAALMLWFNSARTTAPVGWTEPQFCIDFWHWWNVGFGPLLHGYGPGPWVGVYYHNWPGSVTAEVLTGGVNWTVGTDLLPSMSNVTVRRLTAFEPYGIHSIIRLPGIEKSFVQNSALTLSARTTFQAAANKLLLNFSSQGVTFHPLVTYYKAAIAQPPTAARVSQRLCLLKRRGRPGRTNFPQQNGPHPYP